VFSSPNITYSKSKSVGWAGHVERRQLERIKRESFWWGIMKARKHLEDLSTDEGRIKMDLKETV
jgi:hypothetical protein